MFGVILALISSAFHASSNIVDAHIAGKIFKRVPTIIFYAGLTNCLALPFLLFFGTPTAIPLSVLPYLLSIVLIEVFYIPPYYISIKRIDTSIAAALFSLGKVTVPVLAYFVVGEKLFPIQYVGFMVVILFSLILNIDSTKKIKIDLSFWLMLFVSVLLSVQTVLYKKVFEQMDWVSVAFYTIIFYNCALAFLFLHADCRKDICTSFKTYLKNWKVFLSLEILDRAGVITAIVAISLLPVVVSNAVFSVQPIFVLVLSIILYKIFGNRFKEDISKKHILKKMICFVCIIVGIVLTIN